MVHICCWLGGIWGGSVFTVSSMLMYSDAMDCSGQALLSMRFSRQEDWSALPCPLPEDLPSPRIEPRSPGMPSEPPRKSSVTFKLLMTSFKMLLFLFFLDLIKYSQRNVNMSHYVYIFFSFHS